MEEMEMEIEETNGKEDTFFLRFTDDPNEDVAGNDHLTGYKLSSNASGEIQESARKYARYHWGVSPVLFKGKLVASEEFDTFSDVTVIKILTSPDVARQNRG